MKRIVLGYDESDSAKRALERAAQLARAFDSELIVTSVAPIMTSMGRSAGPVDPTDTPADHIEELKHARTYLDGEGVKADYLPGLGQPADTIAELARERDADLIVLGTHEPSAIARLFGQSVSDSVAHKVHCDVLIVHYVSRISDSGPLGPGRQPGVLATPAAAIGLDLPFREVLAQRFAIPGATRTGGRTWSTRRVGRRRRPRR